MIWGYPYFQKQKKWSLGNQSDVSTAVNFAAPPHVSIRKSFKATFCRDGDFFPFQSLPKDKPGTFKGLR